MLKNHQESYAKDCLCNNCMELRAVPSFSRAPEDFTWLGVGLVIVASCAAGYLGAVLVTWWGTL